MRYIFLCCLWLAVLTSTKAQRYGHVNFGNLLAQMPATATAEKALGTFNQAQIAKGEEMVQKLEEEFTAIQRDQANIPPVKLREHEARLQAEQQRILQFEQNISMALDKKRQELLGPIIRQARAAIAAVAEAGDYVLVFDSSLFNALLYTEESTDLLPLVKAELGIE